MLVYVKVISAQKAILYASFGDKAKLYYCLIDKALIRNTKFLVDFYMLRIILCIQLHIGRTRLYSYFALKRTN